MLTVSIVNIGCTVFNLLLLYLVAKKFLFGRVDAVLAQRMEEVDDATRSAEEAKANALNAQKEYEAKMAGVDEEKENILADIKKQGYVEYERIVSDAKKKGEQII
ncbi:MAG: ATP synthase F0 subunit B, partial [Butyrivibrio sp.]|nr:ATP synthase F0 subunit B [Butyrivibrio sp.]